ATGFWHPHAALHAGQALPGIEVVQRISAGVSQPGNLPGERREPRAGRCRARGQARLGSSERRFPPARRIGNGGGGTVAAVAKINNALFAKIVGAFAAAGLLAGIVAFVYAATLTGV